MSQIDGGIVSNSSGNVTFVQVVAARLSHRGFLGGDMAQTAVTSLGGVGSLSKAVPAKARRGGPLLGFHGIAVSEADTVVVPNGNTARALIS